MKNKSVGYTIFSVLNIVILAVVGLVTVLPYVNVLALSLNDGIDSTLGGITIYPRVPTLENFTIILNDANIIKALLNSVSRVVLGTFLALIVQFSAAFAFIYKKLPGRNQLLIFLTIPMFFSGGLIPQYILFSKMHLLNHFLVYIFPTVFSFYNMVIIRTYINTIPKSLEESAKIDGANEITVFARIILPLSKPILATIALWVAVMHWNDWTTTLYFVTKQKLYTLQYILMQMIQEGEKIARMLQQAQEEGITEQIKVKTTPEALKAAQVIITTIPIILVYPFLQKYFIKGVLIGSVKE